MNTTDLEEVINCYCPLCSCQVVLKRGNNWRFSTFITACQKCHKFDAILDCDYKVISFDAIFHKENNRRYHLHSKIYDLYHNKEEALTKIFQYNGNTYSGMFKFKKFISMNLKEKNNINEQLNYYLDLAIFT